MNGKNPEIAGEVGDEYECIECALGEMKSRDN